MVRLLLTLVCVAITGGLAGGCAPATPPPEPVVVTVPDKRIDIDYVRKARADETQEDFLQALEAYKMAQTVNPSNPEARAGRERMEDKLRGMAEAHYQKGLGLEKTGQFGLARQAFLTALRYWPDHPEALSHLRTKRRIATERHIVHTVRPGENLGEIAKTYYGDPRQFILIARYNNIADPRQLRAGQEIKLPQIEGLAFPADPGAMETAAVKTPPQPLLTDLTEQEPAAIEQGADPAEPQEALPDQTAQYREQGTEFFGDKKYDDALIEFRKVLGVIPDDKMALEHASICHFELGMSHFQKQDYLAARNRFAESLKFNRNCRRCFQYLEKSESLYKDLHYKQGMAHYGKEQLTQAIEEWERVSALEPDYKNVSSLINKARAIQSKLEELKQTHQTGDEKPSSQGLSAPDGPYRNTP